MAENCMITEQIGAETALTASAMSHKKRKALLKKEKRKLKRQTEAKKKDEQKNKEEEARKNSPNFTARLVQEEEEEKAMILQMEAESQRQRELWAWHEELYKQKLKQKQEQEEYERLQKIEIEKKIKEEWEERQKKEEAEEEERKKKKEKQREDYANMQIEELLKQARDAENKDGDWSNPLAPVQYGKDRQIETCPFFAKVAACRFGDRCSRSHPYPDTSKTLLFVGMFRHFQLDQGLCEEYDTDIVLEYEDSEVYQKFKEFYEDTLPEFKAIGHVLQFKVCCNFQPHLRGNVYVSYSREDHALETYTKFNARWYGGKQISAQFVEIPSWRRAICGLFGKGRCPKGRECNFLHVFKNPSNEFSMVDRDMVPFTPQHSQRQSNRRRSRSRDRTYSPSLRKHYTRSRSRSPDRHMSSRSQRHYSNYRSRDRSRSPEYRSHDRSSRYDSRSPERDAYDERHRSRSRDRKKKTKKSKHSKHRSRSREIKSNEKHKLSRTESKNGKPSVKVSSMSTEYIDSVENEDVVWVEKTGDSNNRKILSANVSTSRKYRSKKKSPSNSDVEEEMD